jgi:2-iminobutanoate/2-iminopropanoate deaminase
MPDFLKEIITTEHAPKAIGPYSAGIKTEQLIFTAGQLGIIPERGDLIQGGIEQETKQALENIQAILIEAGSSLALVVKTTVFLRDMADFTLMNNIYAGFFKENPPARSTIQVAALPKGAAVEIEAVALAVR